MSKYTQLVLSGFLKINLKSKEVKIPKVCYWHRKNFKKEFLESYPKEDKSRSTGYKICKVLLKYVGEEVKTETPDGVVEKALVVVLVAAAGLLLAAVLRETIMVVNDAKQRERETVVDNGNKINK